MNKVRGAGCRTAVSGRPRGLVQFRYTGRVPWIVVMLLISAGTGLHAQETGIVRGTVIDQDGRAVDAARVVVSRLGASADQFEAETGGDGGYVREALPAGVYAVMAEKEGLSGETFRVRVREGRTVHVTLRLEPGRRVSTWSTEPVGRAVLSSLFSAGVEASRSRDFEEAIDLFRRTLALSPDCVECSYNLAVAYSEVGQLLDAEASFKHVLTVRPDYAAAYYGLSDVYMRQGRQEEAVSVRGEANRLALERLATGRREAADAVERGLAFLNAGNITDAQGRFREALSKNSNYAPAHYWLGVSLLQSNLPERAAASFRRYLQLDGSGEFADRARDHLASLEP